MSDKQIQDWQEKVRSDFGDESKMYEYLFQTMDNFYYRYIETTLNKDLKTTQLGNHLWGAQSKETSMIDALKITNPLAKKGMIEMAKAVPKAMGPEVRYELSSDIQELTRDHGTIKIRSSINWEHPNYNAETSKCEKVVVFKYNDLAQFRKELALKLESACEIFL